jgi:hypothetical protein
MYLNPCVVSSIYLFAEGGLASKNRLLSRSLLLAAVTAVESYTRNFPELARYLSRK